MAGARGFGRVVLVLFECPLQQGVVVKRSRGETISGLTPTGLCRLFTG